MLKYTQGGTMVIFGDSLEETARWLEATPSEWAKRGINASHDSHRGYNWDLGVEWEGAARMAKDGWSEGAQNLAHNLSALPPAMNTHADLRFDVGGHFPDVARYLAGDPANMITRGKRMGNPPVIHLVINFICSGATRAEAFVAYGTAMVAMIDQLEAHGRRVELDVVLVDALRKGPRLIAGWKVKRADDHCDLAAIAFSIGHPAAFRRFGFAMIERSPESAAEMGYGSCAGLTKADAALIDAENALLLDGIGTAYYSGERDMLNLAAKQINKAAGEELVEVEKV